MTALNESLRDQQDTDADADGARSPGEQELGEQEQHDVRIAAEAARRQARQDPLQG